MTDNNASNKKPTKFLRIIQRANILKILQKGHDMSFIMLFDKEYDQQIAIKKRLKS